MIAEDNAHNFYYDSINVSHYSNSFSIEPELKDAFIAALKQLVANNYILHGFSLLPAE